jgi:hypothetical protein
MVCWIFLHMHIGHLNSFFIGLFVFLIMNCKSSLYVLATSLLSENITILYSWSVFYFFHSLSLSLWWGWCLNSGLHTCKPSILLLESHLQSSLQWLFWRWGLPNCLLRVALNHDAPDLSFPSSYDYRHEPPASGSLSYLCLMKNRNF